ncbi:U4/U6.U5 tri-snRNP-associated protein 2, putative [Plasmodium malariae]|uniref:U4/U6.U5 tri-snRNP-associated protein 2, putative n=1 Tax=Plasmodium malariae TaxID=5858 RepID=A0A1D3TE99_PLAMA|nr:U4/U6.U5 tri-snRNP-associated protein 2, putative [Plasmodium malariae]SCP03283.1 U4/U6.U5 tri-snRNP-associated protein 2, putative [Plasmodium malariae]
MDKKPKKKLKNEEELTPKKRKKRSRNENDIQEFSANEMNKTINHSNIEELNNNLRDKDHVNGTLNSKNEEISRSRGSSRGSSSRSNSSSSRRSGIKEDVQGISGGKGRGRICPYLRTINRNLLDFDFEKLCSISLSNLHVYACLVCGLYFQGIGKGTYAYTHALEKNHYVFINLETCKTCCLPENYEIEDASLNDIKYFLKPVYKREEVEYLCYNSILGKSLDGADFFPGCVGLNNLKNTDYCNVVIQLLCTIIPIRNVLLLYKNKQNIAKNLIVVLSELIKKIYNPKNFKGVVSPHEFLQAVGIESKKNFKIGTKNDPLHFFLWIVNKIHRYSERTLKRRKKELTPSSGAHYIHSIYNVHSMYDARDTHNKRNIRGPHTDDPEFMDYAANSRDTKESTSYNYNKQNVNQNSQGEDRVNIPQEDDGNNLEVEKNEIGEGKMEKGLTLKDKKKKIKKRKKEKKWTYDDINIIDYCFDGELIIKTKKKKKKDSEVVESVKDEILKRKKEEMYEEDTQGDKYISDTMDDDELNEKKNYIIQKTSFRTLSLKLPNPPIFKSTTESNIIPQVSIFELLTKFDGETETYLHDDKSAPSTLIISKLPKYLIFTIERFSKNNFFVEKNGTIVNFVIKNLDMKDYVHQDYLNANPVTKYNLIANIFHSGTVNTGSYKIHVLNQPTNEWYEIEDLHVISILPQLVLLPESCVQLYQRQDVQLNGELG